jgi:hypothetical protein
MTSQARIRLVTEGVVASYIHDISARAHTTDVRSRSFSRADCRTRTGDRPSS